MNGLKTSDYDYDLPPDQIAQRPLPERDKSKLLVLRYKEKLIDDVFYHIGNYLHAGDCLVLNDTRVIPARLIGVREMGGTAEVLLLKRLNATDWEALVRPGKKLKIGRTVTFSPELSCEIRGMLSDGRRLVRFHHTGVFEEILSRHGEMPLPPYIHEKLEEKERYQTVYSRVEGSAAAPTAGLHFTPELIKSLEQKGIKLACITLHAGLGTFRPVKVENPEDHVMHEESFDLSSEAAETINRTKASGGRVIAVGTTSMRTLETVAAGGVPLQPSKGTTKLFIRPGFNFKICDGLITNFHLPESTLLMLVSAFYGREEILQAYRHAVETGYRFFSFGDAMLILP